MNIATLGTIITVVAALGGSGYWAADTLGKKADRIEVATKADRAEVRLAVNKTDSTNIVTQKLIEDRISDLEQDKAREKDQAKRASIQRRINDYEKKLESLEKQLLK